MKKTKTKKVRKEDENEWRKGYEAGIKAMINKNAKAIRVGEAIINVMSEIFEFKQEDY